MIAIVMCLVLLICTTTIRSSVLRVLMIEGMSVLVSDEPTTVLCDLPVRTVVKLCTCFCYRGKISFLNCDDICMYLVNTQFELLGFVFISVYVVLKYEISLTLLLGLCGVCDVVLVPYVMW